MYQDIDKQLAEIVDKPLLALKKSQIVGETGKSKDPKAFNEALDKIITDCEKLLETTVKDGVTIDRYGANLINNRIDRLSRMKRQQTLNPESAWMHTEERGTQEPTSEKTRKANAFRRGLDNLLSKLPLGWTKGRLTPTENDR